MNSKVVENERKDGSSSILTFSRDVEVGGGGGGGGGGVGEELFLVDMR